MSLQNATKEVKRDRFLDEKIKKNSHRPEGM